MAVVTAAAAKGERMVFGAIDGTVDAGRVSERIRAIAPKIGGVHKETVRASASPAAFSFVLDRRVTPQSRVAELQPLLAVVGVHLTVVRVQ